MNCFSPVKIFRKCAGCWSTTRVSLLHVLADSSEDVLLATSAMSILDLVSPNDIFLEMCWTIGPGQNVFVGAGLELILTDGGVLLLARQLGDGAGLELVLPSQNFQEICGMWSTTRVPLLHVKIDSSEDVLLATSATERSLSRLSQQYLSGYQDRTMVLITLHTPLVESKNKFRTNLLFFNTRKKFPTT